MTDPAAAGVQSPAAATRAHDAATMLLSLAADLPHPPRARRAADPGDALRVLGDWAMRTACGPADAADDRAGPPAVPARRPRLLVGCAPSGRRTAAAMVAAAQLLVGERMLPQQESDPTATVAEAQRAVDDEVDGGADLLLLVGDDAERAPALGLASLLSGVEPAALMRFDSARDDDQWMRDLSAVRDARRAAAASTSSAAHSVTAGGGAALLAATAALLQSARRRTPVIIDGLTPAVAALVAGALAPGIAGWWRLAGNLAPPVESLVQSRLALEPVCPLGADAPTGAAGALAVALVRMAVAAER